MNGTILSSNGRWITTKNHTKSTDALLEKIQLCQCSATKAILGIFLSKRKIAGECWHWGDYKSYGSLKIGATTHRVSHLSYEIFVGRIPKGLIICHHCDNPPCFNPAHLFPGTNDDNVADAMKKGRTKNRPRRPIRLAEKLTGVVSLPDDLDGRFAKLTGREREILTAVGMGYTNAQTAESLNISSKTVEKHRQKCNDKLGINNAVFATLIAFRFGLVHVENYLTERRAA